jgi:hypothetical protein
MGYSNLNAVRDRWARRRRLVIVQALNSELVDVRELKNGPAQVRTTHAYQAPRDPSNPSERLAYPKCNRSPSVIKADGTDR